MCAYMSRPRSSERSARASFSLPTACGCSSASGWGAEISRCGARLADTQLCRADGRPVAHDPEQFSRPGERYGMHRADLLAMLAPSGQQMRESWSGPGDPAALAARFAGWDPVVGTIIDAIGSTGFRWGLYDRAPLRHCAAGSAAG